MLLLRTAAARAGREVRFVIFGFEDPGCVYPQLESVEKRIIDRDYLARPRGFARSVRGCDLVVDIGAGDSLADIYGPKRLTYLLATKAVTLAMGRPLVLAPQTIGPFESNVTRGATEGLIACSQKTFARDAVSVDRLRNRHARAKTTITTDVAFVLPYERNGDGGSKVRVGINVSGLIYQGESRGRNNFALKIDYRSFVDQTLAYFAGRPEVEIVLVPHVVVPGSHDDDLSVSREIATTLGLAEPPVLTDPVMAKSLISGLDFLVATRMHACIAAVSSGVATIPIAYSRKFSGLFGNLGYDHTVEAGDTDTETAVEAVVRGYEQRERLAEDAKLAAARADTQLEHYVDEMTRIFRAL